MSSVSGALFVTGIARHSLGEAFLNLYLTKQPSATVIGADLYPPIPRFAQNDHITAFEFDLNPLSSMSRYSEFADRLGIALESALERVAANRIDCLIQGAGVYDFGAFLDHDVIRRARILGVNLVGHLEVLHSVMSLNARRGVDNATALTYVDVGSFQGLHARAERSVYAPSKAAGIDLDGALFEGKEVARSLYFAPASIDTHMLHFNHWVKKSRGSEKLFDSIRDGDRKEYEAIFIHCDQKVLGEVARRCGVDAGEALRTLEAYVAARHDAFHSALGVLGVETCAQMLCSLVMTPDKYPSGVYLAYAPDGGQPKLIFAEFSRLSRLKLLEGVGSSIQW